MDLISLLILVATGLVVGLVARTLLPGTADMGVAMTTVLGIAGAALAQYGGAKLGYYPSGGVMSFVASVIGAAVRLLIISVLRR